MIPLILTLALAVGIGIFFYYAARAAFVADSKQRAGIDKKFAEIVALFKTDDKPNDAA